MDKYFYFRGFWKIRNTQIDMILLKFLVSFNFPGVKWRLGKKHPNTQMCFWDGEFLQGRNDVPQITPSKSFRKNKRISMWFHLEILTQLYIKFSKFQNPKMPGHKLSKNFPFFSQWKTSTHLPIWWRGVFFRLSDWGSPGRMSFCFTGAT